MQNPIVVLSTKLLFFHREKHKFRLLLVVIFLSESVILSQVTELVGVVVFLFVCFVCFLLVGFGLVRPCWMSAASLEVL